MELVFWISVALIGYTYAGYPLLLLVMASLQQMRRDLSLALGHNRRKNFHDPELPNVSLVFAAHNEAAVIVGKMRNCAAIDYPANKIEILIGCDACSDDTAELARNAGGANATVFDYRERSGKPAVLNRLVAAAKGEIVVFCDANTMFEAHAVRSLVRHFSSPAVGCACGELRLRPSETGARNEGFYWRYEGCLKFFESRLNMLVGANGGIFAVRRSLFQPLPPRAIVDDFLIAMEIRRQGHQVVFDCDAAGYETAAASVREEFVRRVRIGAGNFHALLMTWRMLLPGAGRIAFSYWSHKVLRWIAPFAMLTAFGAAVALSSRPFYAVCAFAGVALGMAGVLGYRQALRSIHRGVWAAPYYFLSMNLALLIGFWKFASGQQGAVWQRTPRHREL
jgi:cellulose synthase/poly-beta-1,6-N-acetylglucosamine synthase-like glycosyltransferase